MTSPYLQDVLEGAALRLEGAARYCKDDPTLGNVLEHVKMALRQVHASQAMMRNEPASEQPEPGKSGGQTMSEEPMCECASGTHNEPGGPCKQRAVMHLYRVADSGLVAFCMVCGDDAMWSGLFATGEDVAAARREGGQ